MNDRFMVRYWCKDSKKYLDSHKLVYNNGTYTQFSTKQSSNGTYHSYIVCDWNTSELIPEQCSGLKDKNGKLIYEGDILQDCEQRIRVVFDEQRYCFMFEYQNTRAYKPITCIDVLDSELEVIGNVHENEGLLK